MRRKCQLRPHYIVHAYCVPYSPHTRVGPCYIVHAYCARYSPHTRAGAPAVRHAARIPTPRMVGMQVGIRRARLGSRARPRKHSYTCNSLGRDLLICSTVLLFFVGQMHFVEQKQICSTADLGNLDVLFDVKFVQQNISRNSRNPLILFKGICRTDLLFGEFVGQI